MKKKSMLAAFCMAALVALIAAAVAGNQPGAGGPNPAAVF